MLPKQLQTALRLRKLAVEATKRNLADALAAETQASTALIAARDALRRERAAAADLLADDAAVEAFAAWHATGKAAETSATEALHRYAADAAHARAILGAARSAEASVEAMVKNLAAAAAVASAKADQAVIDEVAARGRERAAGHDGTIET